MKNHLFTILTSLVFKGFVLGQCPTITITPASSTLLCGVSPATFTAATSPSTNVIRYWEQANVGSLSGVTCTPGTPGIYTFCAIEKNSGCKTTQTVQVILGNNTIPQITVTAANNNFSIGCTPCVSLTMTGFIIGGAASGVRWLDAAMTNTLSPNNNYSTCTSSNYVAYAYNLSSPNCSVAAMMTIYQNTSAVSYISSSNPTLCVGQTATISAYGANSYTWSTTSNSNSIVVSPTVTTSYSVTAINTTNSCTSTTVYSQIVSTCTGIQEVNTIIGAVNIYPNPNSGILNIQLGVGNNSFITIKNSLGQTVVQKENVNGDSILDISELTSGIYIMELRTGGTTSVIKLIKE